MIFVVAILGVLLIGWFVPRLVMARLAGRAGMVAGIALAWALGFAFVYGAAWLVAEITAADLKDEVERAVNAWKLILLVAPASALARRRS